uniref:FecR family protein n=1 Tax=Pedobacter schmidteae TaxID=2201271 RepID=UPI000EB501A1|nr:FecR domain-containing protein [Pedobacter schmidteae]
MTREEFLCLFEKQLQGNITPDEEARLAAWFDQQQSEGLSEWDEAQLSNQNDIKEAIYNHIQPKKGRKQTIRLYPAWIGIAASITLISLAIFFLQKSNTARQEISAATAAIKYTEAKATYGQVLKVTLADSSTVWLNAGSRLRYPEKFSGSIRELYLEGEAFFSVIHKKDQPFIVHSGALSTQVLGTSFNIKAYKNARQLKVSVATGKVAIYTDKANTAFLTPNQSGTYSKGTKEIKTAPDQISDITAWRTGKLVYKNELLSQVLEDIGNKYGVDIAASPGMNHCQVYGTFNHDNIETLLKMIAYSVNGKVIKKASGFYLSGKGCN